MDATNDEKERTLHTMSYVTRGFIKREEAQKVIENARQAIQQSEITSEANTLKNYLTDNESLPYDIVDDCTEILLSE